MGFQDFSPGNGWQSTNSALEMEQFVQPRLLMTGLENQNNELCCDNVALQYLTAPEVWWLVSVCSLPPLLGSHLPSHTALGQRSHQNIWVWGAFFSWEQLIPAEMVHPWSLPGPSLVHPCPAVAPFHVTVPADTAFLCREAVLGLTRSQPLLCPRSHRAFQPLLGQLQVAPGQVFKVSTCWIATRKSPTVARGKQVAGNAVAPAWISAVPRLGILPRHHPSAGLQEQRSAPGFSISPVPSSPPRRASKISPPWISPQANHAVIVGKTKQPSHGGSLLLNLLQCHTGFLLLCHPTLSLHQLGRVLTTGMGTGWRNQRKVLQE
ncbi:uncharacterized protein LOC120502257 [Passer montanus]|uniref:uncharacterized protein LOC120502257 n=1 Tax=Passer montanus TaxID=9160 RepID=UPI0019615AEA|nr:uncharacterized protein LOC120502257 [Passer montanus]